MSEHVMFKDSVRHKIVCSKCGMPWPCGPKKDEILERIRERIKQQEANNQ